jgi:hypothetical protein
MPPIVATRDLSGLLFPKGAKNPSMQYSLSICQDYPSPMATRLQITYERLVALEKMLAKSYMVQSKVWEVVADLAQTASERQCFRDARMQVIVQ